MRCFVNVLILCVRDSMNKKIHGSANNFFPKRQNLDWVWVEATPGAAGMGLSQGAGLRRVDDVEYSLPLTELCFTSHSSCLG